MAERGQVLGVSAGAAGRLSRDAGRQAIQDLPDDGLFQVDELVPWLIVGFGPGPIALHAANSTEDLGRLSTGSPEDLRKRRPGQAMDALSAALSATC